LRWQVADRPSLFETGALRPVPHNPAGPTLHGKPYPVQRLPLSRANSVDATLGRHNSALLRLSHCASDGSSPVLGVLQELQPTDNCTTDIDAMLPGARQRIRHGQTVLFLQLRLPQQLAASEPRPRRQPRVHFLCMTLNMTVTHVSPAVVAAT